MGGASERRLTDQVIKAHHSSFPFRVRRKKSFVLFCERKKRKRGCVPIVALFAVQKNGLMWWYMQKGFPRLKIAVTKELSPRFPSRKSIPLCCPYVFVAYGKSWQSSKTEKMLIVGFAPPPPFLKKLRAFRVRFL